MKAWVVSAVCVVLGSASAQVTPTQQSLESQLKSEVLVLRGMFAGRHLDFDTHGNLIGSAKTLPFSLSALTAEKISLSDSHLTIECRRDGLKFVMVGDPIAPLRASAEAWSPRETVTITVARNAQHPELLETALDRIFSFGLDEALDTTAPAYWRPWLDHRFRPDSPVEAPPPGVYGEDGLRVRNIHDGVTPPQLLHAVTPVYPEQARRAKDEDTDVIGLVVDPSGNPVDVHIVRPVGMGMDEAAVTAVSQYRFAPATKNSKAVAAAISVEVSFELPGKSGR